MKFRKPYKRHHRRRSNKKDTPNWSAPKDVQKEFRKKDFKRLHMETVATNL